MDAMSRAEVHDARTKYGSLEVLSGDAQEALPAV